MTPTAQTLLAFLLLQRTFSPRDVLASLCWGDQPDEQARNCLNTALWRLRRSLDGAQMAPDTYLLTMPTGEVSFNWGSNHWLDVTTFEQAAVPLLNAPASTLTTDQVQGLESALALYTGDLLEGFYDDWALRERERVRGMYLDSLARLMRFHHARGAYAEGLAAGQKLLAHDPLREEIHREMMRLYLKTGERALAVRQYHLCREILADELSILPMAETEALYQQILSVGEPPSAAESLSEKGRAGRPALLEGWPAAMQSRGLRTTQDAQPAARTAVAQALSQLRRAMHDFEHARDRLQRAVQSLERLTGDRGDEPKM